MLMRTKENIKTTWYIALVLKIFVKILTTYEKNSDTAVKQLPLLPGSPKMYESISTGKPSCINQHSDLCSLNTSTDDGHQQEGLWTPSTTDWR